MIGQAQFRRAREKLTFCFREADPFSIGLTDKYLNREEERDAEE